MKTGWLSILKNSKQLLTNTRSNVSRIRAVIHTHCNDKNSKLRQHTECTPLRLRIDEEVVQDLLSCFSEFESNPFDLVSPSLRTLESGIKASPDVLMDLKTALRDGREDLESLFRDRVFSKESSLFAHTSRKKRKTFAKQLLENNSGRQESSKLQLRDMESKALASVINLFSKSGMELERLLKYRVTQECLSIFNVNGMFRKAQKSKLMARWE